MIHVKPSGNLVTQKKGRNVVRLFLCFGISLAVFLSPSILLVHPFMANASSQPPSPIGLTISTRTPLLPADGGTHDALILEFKNLTSGMPFIPQNDLMIYLSSSNLQVGNVSSSVPFPAGSLFVTALFTTTSLPGNTIISAFAAGYPSASITVNTSIVGGPSAIKLVLSVAPSLILARQGESAAVSVQLQDAVTSSPVIAASDVQVILTSSNSSVATVANTTIPKGSSYEATGIVAGGLAGVANITASAQGYIKASALVTAESTPTGAVPDQLSLSFVPGLLLPNGQTYTGAAVVELQYFNQTSGIAYPATYSSTKEIDIRSSNNATLFVDPSPIEIQPGQTHVSVDITSTYLPGNAQITAQGQNLSSVTESLVSYGSTPTHLAVYGSPSLLLASNSSYPSLTVQLQDSSGKPQKADVDIPVQLTTATYATGSVTPEVTIMKGSTFAVADITTTLVPGAINVSAFASGYQPGKASLSSTVLPIAATVKVTTPNILINGRTNVTVSVEYSGMPLQGASVTWPSTTGVWLDAANSTDANGVATATFQAESFVGSIPIHIEISKLGYATYTASAGIQVISPPTQTNTQNNGIMGIQFLSIPLIILGPIIVAVPVISFIMVRRFRGGTGLVEEEE